MTLKQKRGLPVRTKKLHSNFMSQLALIEREYLQKESYYKKVFDLAIKHGKDLRQAADLRKKELTED